MSLDKTCCFMGHRRLPGDKTARIVTRLDREVERLIGLGVTDFISGGALGFDQLAAALIVSKRSAGKNIRLIYVLPCREQEKNWDAPDRRLYHRLLIEADEIVYVSERYEIGCMQKCSRCMADRSAYCLCAQTRPFGRMARTIAYARKNGLCVINVMESCPP